MATNQAVIVHKRQAIQLDEVTTGIPPELLLRRDQSVRYERNGTVYATDGRVGVLRRVVVDERMGEVVDLVIEVEGGRLVLIPPDLVDKTAGSAVFLTANRTQFSERSSRAPGFEARRFERADRRALQKTAAGSPSKTPRRAIAEVGKHFVETPAASLVDRLDQS
jgi:hypothetical protein